MSTYYDDYRNSYYNPDDVEEQPGDNRNWQMIQKGFDTIEKDVTHLTDEVFTVKNPALTVPANATASFTASVDEDTIAAIESGDTNYWIFTDTNFKTQSALIVLPAKVKYTVSNTDLYVGGAVSGTVLKKTGTNFVFTLYNTSSSDIVLAANAITIGYYLYKRI